MIIAYSCVLLKSVQCRQVFPAAKAQYKKDDDNRTGYNKIMSPSVCDQGTTLNCTTENKIR